MLQRRPLRQILAENVNKEKRQDFFPDDEKGGMLGREMEALFTLTCGLAMRMSVWAEHPKIRSV